MKRQSSKTDSPTTPAIEVVVASYAEKEWSKWREAMEDGEQFFTDYQSWKQILREAVNAQRQLGRTIALQTISLEGFLTYAKTNALPLTSDSRSQYAAVIYSP